MHIVHVITRFLRAGSEENTIATCCHHAAQGHRVTLVHGDEFDERSVRLLAGKADVVAQPSLIHPIRPWKDASAVADLHRLLVRLQPDVVHTHQSKAGIVGRVAAKSAGVPAIVHTVHIAPFDNVAGLRRTGFVEAERLCARFTDVMITVSAGMRDLFLAEGIADPSRYRVIHSGMDIRRFRDARPPADWRGRLGFTDGEERPLFMVMLAAFEPRKRQRELIEALAPFLRTRSDLCLVLAGQGDELEKCKALARELGVDERIRFPGHDPRPEELIALADLCLLTSIREGLPRAVIQYIAAGKPCLVSPLPGLEELVSDGRNGVVASSDRMDVIAREIMALVDDRSRLRSLGEGAAATDLSSWSEEVMGRRIEESYREVLDRKGVRP